MSKKEWPKNCAWPEPRSISWGEWDFDDVGENDRRVSAELDYLMEIREYFELLEDEETEDEDFTPDIGEEFWDNGRFDIEFWQDELEEEMSKLKLSGCSAAYEVERTVEYDFADENLIRQAFTRRAFAREYGLTGSCEELEFIGDRTLDYVLVRLMAKEYSEVNTDDPGSPFRCRKSEGDMTQIRNRVANGEYLAARASELGLDKYILYGTAEEETDKAKADMIEALIGAAAVDSDWDYNVLSDVVESLLGLQLERLDNFCGKDMYETFNTWHQQHFQRMPEYEVYRVGTKYYCTLRYFIPENTKGLIRDQRVDVCSETRSSARATAAEMAFYFVDSHGLWMNLSDAKIEPELDKSINQLQELFQKKYLSETPQYSFSDNGTYWTCTCRCDTFCGVGEAKNKTAAKKAAAFRTLTAVFKSAGIARDDWGTGILFVGEDKEI